MSPRSKLIRVVLVLGGAGLLALALPRLPRDAGVLVAGTVIAIIGFVFFRDHLKRLAGRPPATGSTLPASSPTRAWAVGTSPWGGVTLECGTTKIVVVLLPITDPGPYAAVPTFPTGLVDAVVVFNAGTEGVVAASAIARKAGLAQVFALDTSRPVDRGVSVEGEAVRVLPLPRAQRFGELLVERVTEGLRVTWPGGVAALVGDALPLSAFFDHRGTVVGGARLDPSQPHGFTAFPTQVVLMSNVAGPDQTLAAQALAAMGVGVTLTDRPPSLEGTVINLLALGRIDEAEAMAKQALGRGEQADRMHFQLGIAALMRKDAEAAVGHFTAGADAGSAEACSSLAGLLAERGDRRALGFAKQALERLPQDPVALRSAVLAHARLGEPEAGKALLSQHGAGLGVADRVELEQVLSGEVQAPEGSSHRFPAHARLVSGAARQFLDEGRREEAEPLLRRAHELDPAAPEHVADLGVLLTETRRDAEALALYDAAVARGGLMELVRFNRGNCHLRASRFGAAAADFSRCLEIRPEWHDARVNLTSALVGNGDRKGAEQHLEELRRRAAPAHLVMAVEQMLRG